MATTKHSVSLRESLTLRKKNPLVLYKETDLDDYHGFSKHTFRNQNSVLYKVLQQNFGRI